ncbi:hypothetical protein [Pseudoxanthomonas suwonensis]|uniref:hypothetical protein n=1 Tax=Pseudoxanthomonas suwonensis TaxID=314722 RepID=UPI00048E5E8A|nr:hypothetical protein [Pseudoxanthomonas suwonensis]
MNTGASAWSPQQRRWLQALGYSVLRLGDGDDAVEAVAEQAPEAAPERVPARVHSPVDGSRHERDVAPVRRAPPPPVTPAALEQDSAPAAPVRGALRRPPRLPDRLQLAMLRASGLDPADPAAQALMAEWPVDELRGNPAAKRAFWPKLRALRRRSP